MHKEVMRLSEEHPRYGYRRITVLLQRAGMLVNAKRVQRVRRIEGLQVRRRERRMRRVMLEQKERLRAVRPRQVWSWDFVEDQIENGTRFRILTLLDEYTREGLALHAAWSIRAVDVITVIEATIERYGAPEYIRSDNGPEFIAYAIQDWLKEQEIKSLYIKPGSPWENPFIESFHDKLRDECLNRELFGTLAEARVILESWRVEYNEERPHSSLGKLTPGEFARAASKFGLQSASCRKALTHLRANQAGGLLPPKLAKIKRNGFMQSDNQQNYTYKVSHFWGQATAHGLRRARYRGKAKVDLQNQFIGAACNIKRWLRLLAQQIQPKAPQNFPPTRCGGMELVFCA